MPYLVRALFGSCPIWFELFLICTLFGSCPIWFVLFLICALFGLCPILFVLFLVCAHFLLNLSTNSFVKSILNENFKYVLKFGIG